MRESGYYWVITRGGKPEIAEWIAGSNGLCGGFWYRIGIPTDWKDADFDEVKPLRLTPPN